MAVEEVNAGKKSQWMELEITGLYIIITSCIIFQDIKALLM